MRHLCFYIVLMLVLQCCNKANHSMASQRPRMQDQAKFASWVEENQADLVNSRTIEDLVVDVRYMPSASESNTEFNFILNIYSKTGDKILDRPNARFSDNDSKMMYWSSGVRQFLLLVTDVDTIPCSAVIYENLGGIKPGLTLNVGFSSKLNTHTTYTLIYDDVYFKLGRLNFTFDEVINKVPLTEISN